MPQLQTSNLLISVTRVIVIIVGIIGSIISFIVFSRKTFRKNSISTYSRALAVIDCLSLIQLVQDFYRLSLTTMFSNQNDFTCKIFYYLWMEYTSIPGWILVAFSIDKMLNMRTSAPKILKSKLFQLSLSVGIILFHILIYSELLFSLKIDLIHDVYMCNFNFIDYYRVFTYAQLSISCLIPFPIILTTTIITIRSIWKSRASLKRTGSTDKHRKLRDIKYAVSSVAFNVFFIVFKVPLLLSPYFKLSGRNLDISILLFIISCSSSVFIHFASNLIFRREFLTVFALKMSNN